MKVIAIIFVAVVILQISNAVAEPAKEVANPGNQENSSTKKQQAKRLEVSVKDGKLSLIAENYPLEWVLARLTEGTGVAIETADGLDSERVSIVLENILFDEGLRKILKDQDAFFFYGAGKDSTAKLMVVWVYPGGRGSSVMPIPPEQWASTKELKTQIDDPDPYVRSRAITTLINRLGEKALDLALKSLKNERDAKVRTSVLYAATDKEVDLPADFLGKLAMSDPSENVRFLALQALESDPNVRPLAERALKDPSQHVQNLAKEILEELDRREGTKPGKK